MSNLVQQEEDMLAAKNAVDINFIQVLDDQGNPSPQPEVELTTASSEVVEVPKQKLTQQQIDQQQYDEWLVNPQNKENALSLASQIIDVVGKNWFSITRLCSKAHIGRQDAYQKVQMCKLFGYAEVRLGNYRDGRENVQVPLFKITISKEDKVKALDQIIQYHKDQIEAFEIQKKQYL